MNRLLLAFLFTTILLATRSSAELQPCTHRTVQVTGTIRDRDGSILPGARVTYRGLSWNKDCSEGRWTDYETNADSLGVYSITGPEQGKLLVVHPNRQSYPPELAIREDLRTGYLHADYQLQMFRLQGHLVDSEGHDAKGVTLYYGKGGGMDIILGNDRMITTPRFELFLPRGKPYAFLVRAPGIVQIQIFNVTLSSDTSITYSVKPE